MMACVKPVCSGGTVARLSFLPPPSFLIGAALGNLPGPEAVEGMGVECIGDVSEEGGSTQALTRSANNSKEAPKKPAQTGGSKDPKAKDAGKAKDTVGPFLFNDSFPPIPAKLVEKIQTGEFVDMAELLQDGITLSWSGAGDRVRAERVTCRREGRCQTSSAGVHASAHTSAW